MRFARICLCVLWFAACDRQPPQSHPARAELRVVPDEIELAPGETHDFHARGVRARTAWTVAEGAAGGIIAATGLYSAPDTPGTYHVVARSGGLSAAAVVHVVDRAAVQVQITPPVALLEGGGSLRFSATVTGAPGGEVSWRIAEGNAGGTVDASGLYLAPGAGGTFHLIASSVADPARSATAVITVSLPTIQISISPLSITTAPGAKLQFSAEVSGTQDVRVEWSSDCCAISQDGTLIAPPQERAAYVVARSVADRSQAATAVILVDASPRGIDPAAAIVPAGGQVAFHAASADYSVREGLAGGSITRSGQYQAPRDHGGTFHVVAGAATATVTVLPPDLVDHGGPLSPATRTFAVWWGDSAGWVADVRATQEALLRGLDGSSYLALAGQYLRGAAASTRFGGSFSDLSAPPDSPGTADGQTVGAEACSALQAGGITPADGDLVFVYGSKGLDPAPAWCAWHTMVACGSAQLMVAFVPNVAGSWSCLALGAPAGCNALSADANATASLTAHELMETITDPLATAWTDADGEELGDKCEDQLRCIALSTGAFQLQAEYSNAAHACAP